MRRASAPLARIIWWCGPAWRRTVRAKAFIGRFLHGDGTLVGSEFRVNTTTAGQQMQPAVASDGANQFVVTWTSYTGSPYNFDLFAQRYININLASNLPAMSAPFVWAPFTLSNGVYQPQLQVSWPLLLGHFRFQLQGVMPTTCTNTPIALVSDQQSMDDDRGKRLEDQQHALVPSGLRHDRPAVSRRCRRPPAARRGAAGVGAAFLMNGWRHISADIRRRVSHELLASASTSAAAGGPTLLQVFLIGRESERLRHVAAKTLTQTTQGLFLNWNTQPGRTYQVLANHEFDRSGPISARRGLRRARAIPFMSAAVRRVITWFSSCIEK